MANPVIHKKSTVTNSGIEFKAAELPKRIGKTNLNGRSITPCNPILRKRKIHEAFKEVKAEQSASDSDDELVDNKTIVTFARKVRPPVVAMTIPCRDKNVKGSTLIEIAHNVVRSWYDGAVDMACEYEKDIGGALIPTPNVNGGILSIQHPRDWFMSLGGWKGMMPSEEIKEYFFNESRGREVTRFSGVEIYKNGVVFPIDDQRLHLPEGFIIKGEDVTKSWRKEGNKWFQIQGKTDLSYSQIVRAIDGIKKNFEVSDAQIAKLQLAALSRERGFPLWFNAIAKENQKEILQFLDYLNALMFGIEASGLNAALVEGLMILDLIADGHIDYKNAFKANEDGGIYPYACFGDNKGTYRARENILVHKKTNATPLSMKPFRTNTSLSPIATKEAILIKMWLEHNQAVLETGSHAQQVKAIKDAIEDLVSYYYSPWLNRNYTIKKFAPE